MKRLPHLLSALLFVSTAAQATAVPDFWYVVPDETSISTESANRLVRGIVIPSVARPSFEATPEGSVVSWRRPDGTRQSVVVQGSSSIRFEPGPLTGTTFVPFNVSKRLAYDPRGCCACASWLNSVESVEALSCVAGCAGCGCEGCICSPTFPCPTGPDGSMTLLASDASAPTMTFEKSGAKRGINVVVRGGSVARFRGKNLVARVSSKGNTVINNPDSIALSGAVKSRSTTTGSKELYAWQSLNAAVILEQQGSMPAPSFEDGVIDFDSRSNDAPTTESKHLKIAPLMDRCTACGTHPDSDSDLEIYDCVPGSGVCYRCVSWECVAQES